MLGNYTKTTMKRIELRKDIELGVFVEYYV